eukprot:CAMPEP_0179450170 /NCGR_PEP_ID=MMETSP0799-20121207/34070_1 /TAXON_ID=46947 /ORGANISM="Geminigera cryophila, Strain CCMP2564" /LENGTH=244 /DNA_ID=CAMNT_0021243853 /DNA_START=351 /DNA_END=1081 /DNA_ORIENTATION=+
MQRMPNTYNSNTSSRHSSSSATANKNITPKSTGTAPHSTQLLLPKPQQQQYQNKKQMQQKQPIPKTRECKVPLRATCTASLRSGPSLDTLKSWPKVVRLAQVGEQEAHQALKDRPKHSKISIVVLTAGAQADSAHFQCLRQTLQTSQKAAVVTHKAGVVTQGCGESLSYIFAWKDEILSKKKMPPNSLVCFILSFTEASNVPNAANTPGHLNSFLPFTGGTISWGLGAGTPGHANGVKVGAKEA